MISKIYVHNMYLSLSYPIQLLEFDTKCPLTMIDPIHDYICRGMRTTLHATSMA